MGSDPAGLRSTLRVGCDGAIGMLVRTVALSFVCLDRRTCAFVVLLTVLSYFYTSIVAIKYINLNILNINFKRRLN